MNRDLDQAAALLGIKPRRFRQQLRDLGVLTTAGELASKHRDKGTFYVDARSRWHPKFQRYVHYGVVMVSEPGITWLTKELGISVTQYNKDAAA